MNNLANMISMTLRHLRRDNGWSLDVASRKTGVSKAMLGQIERKESSPTIATLWKIASGFNTSFSSFIGEPVSRGTAPVHSSSLRAVEKLDDGISIMPLFPFDEKLSFEIFVIEIMPGCEHLSLPHNGGVVEHVVAVEGVMEVLINTQWQQVNKSEGLRFEANQPHGYRNTSTAKAIFHNMIHYDINQTN